MMHSVTASLSHKAIFRQGSRTFYFASRLLPAEARRDVEVLYSFCRMVDDVVDNPESHDVALGLFSELKSETLALNCNHSLVGEFCQLVTKHGISENDVERFFRGQESDLLHKPIQNLDELIQYCNCVASSVGSMLLPILGVSDSRALPHAEALGTAMQLTNISRDIAEDFHRGRVYLPASLLQADCIRQAIHQRDPASIVELNRARRDLLEIADTYYDLADRGMIYLPRPARLSIRAAAGAYRAIGDSIRRLPADDMTTRACTSSVTKLQCVIRSLVKSFGERHSSHEVSVS